jgi:hypothetical protein
VFEGIKRVACGGTDRAGCFNYRVYQCALRYQFAGPANSNKTPADCLMHGSNGAYHPIGELQPIQDIDALLNIRITDSDTFETGGDMTLIEKALSHCAYPDDPDPDGLFWREVLHFHPV